MSLFDRVHAPQLAEDSRRKKTLGKEAKWPYRAGQKVWKKDSTNPLHWDEMSRALRKRAKGALKRAGVKPRARYDDKAGDVLDKDARFQTKSWDVQSRDRSGKRARVQPGQGVKTKGAAFEKASAAAGQDAQRARAQSLYDRTKKVPKGWRLTFGKVSRAK